MNDRSFPPAFFSATLAVCLSAVVHAQAPDWEWALSAGLNQVEQVECLTTDADGNSIIVGTYKSFMLTFGTDVLLNAQEGTTDLFVAKHDADGDPLWAITAGGTEAEEALSVATDAAGNIYVTGFFESVSITLGTNVLTNAGSGSADIFLMKLDPNGNVLWAQRAGGSAADEAGSLAIDPAGNCHLTGFFASPTLEFDLFILTNSGAADMFVAKFDTDGNALWANSAGAAIGDRGRSVATDAAGNSYVGGFFEGPVIVFDLITLTNNGAGSDLFLVKYDVNGEVIWATSAGGTGFVETRGVATDGVGNCYITGTFACASLLLGTTTLTNAGTGEDDLFVVKFNTDGEVVWARRAGGPADDRARAIAVDGSGGAHVAGYFKSSLLTFGAEVLVNAFPGDDDLFVVRFDPDGAVAWAVTAGGVGSTRAHGLAFDDAGNCLVAGYFSEDVITFGTTALVNGGIGAFDLFLAKLGTAVGIDEAETAGILSAHPNPSAGVFTLDLLQPRLAAPQWAVHDALGQEILRSYTNEPLTQVDLSAHAAGIYSLTLWNRYETTTVKLIKQ